MATPKKGLAAVLDVEDGGDPAEEASESAGEGEVEAMQAFTSAKTDEAKLAAFKDLLKICGA